jgi:single stranded DNA-binding protein
MSEINKIIISGRIGKTPEVRKAKDESGRAYALFPLAVNRSFLPAGSKEWQQETMWFNITVTSQFLVNKINDGVFEKGYHVLVDGRVAQNVRVDEITQKRITYWSVIINNGGSIKTLSRPMEKNNSQNVSINEDADIPF